MIHINIYHFCVDKYFKIVPVLTVNLLASIIRYLTLFPLPLLPSKYVILSQGQFFPLKEHSAISDDIWGCHYWWTMTHGQGCSYTSNNAQDSPRHWPKCSQCHRWGTLLCNCLSSYFPIMLVYFLFLALLDIFALVDHFPNVKNSMFWILLLQLTSIHMIYLFSSLGPIE